MITVRYYEPGEVIFHENDRGDAAYIIERGRVAVTKLLNGRPVTLATLSAGEPFGEMSMIDDKPRSATVTAIETTSVREIPREGFFRSLQTNPEVALSLLKVLFERLRETDATIVELRQVIEGLGGSAAQPEVQIAVTDEAVVILEGLTPQAEKALPVTPFPIDKFPFRIGRATQDPLVHNDLMLTDVLPPQLSRHHVAIINYAGNIGVADRGSYLGALVDNRRLGGLDGSPGPLFFSGSEGLLVLGEDTSPFRFKVVLLGQQA